MTIFTIPSTQPYKKTILKKCSFKLSHRPHLYRVEIELTTRCNLLCLHCDRRCSKAPANIDLPVSFIEKFVDESLSLRYPWQKISLIGGEPTLHPNLRDIIAILKEYVKAVDCELLLVSNAYGSHVNKILGEISGELTIIKRPKTNNETWFNNMDLAPVDFVSQVSSCHNTQNCGLGLSALGYFPCGAGAAIARTVGFTKGIMSLKEVSEESMTQLLQQLCQYCGHAIAIPVGENSNCSPFWRDAYSVYRKQYDGQ